MSAALKTTPVGIIVERHKASSQWIDYVWRPVAAGGVPQMKPWTVLSHDGDVTTFYAGAAEVEFFRTATSNYRDNLAGDQSLWVILQPTESDPPYALLTVTADPSEGEALAGTGTNLVEAVHMPDNVREALIDFVAEHHIEQPFFKRKRDRADPEALARRDPMKDRKEP
ncbi:MAG: DUF3305 domain-containing protein [Pseudorhodoplanes sp.]|nr:DUF3305 domain-containing protein [Pseudorhodoplanes sp.]